MIDFVNIQVNSEETLCKSNKLRMRDEMEDGYYRII